MGASQAYIAMRLQAARLEVSIALIDVQSIHLIVSLTQLNDIATYKGRAKVQTPHESKLRLPWLTKCGSRI
jgi:hypothetical protein